MRAGRRGKAVRVHGFNMEIEPPSLLTWLWKKKHGSTGNTSSKGWFSIVMSVNSGVYFSQDFCFLIQPEKQPLDLSFGGYRIQDFGMNQRPGWAMIRRIQLNQDLSTWMENHLAIATYKKNVFKITSWCLTVLPDVSQFLMVRCWR